MEQRAVEPVRVESVRVLSWNLWCHLFVGGAEPSARLARFACVVEEIKPDIVCVQEVFEGKAVFVSMTTLLNQLSQTMEMFGYTMVRSRATVPWLYGQDSGLVSFVKHRKVVSHETVKFEKLSEWICNKGYQSFDCDDGLTVFNCHLDATGPHKAAQVQQLCRAVKRVTDAGRPVVVTGDFNICQQHVFDGGELYQMLSREMADCGLTDSFSDSKLVTFPGEGACLDHLFSNCIELSARVAPNRRKESEPRFSDHCGLDVVLSRRFHIALYDPAKHRQEVMDIFSANLTQEWSVYGNDVLQQVAIPYVAHSCETDLADVGSVYDKFWVCVDGEAKDRVVGMVGLQRLGPKENEKKDRRELQGPKEGELRRMHLLPDYRGKGLGTKMGFSLLAFARSNCYKTIELSTPEHNKDSIRFYKRLGFADTDKRTPVPGSNGRFSLEHFVVNLTICDQ